MIVKKCDICGEPLTIVSKRPIFGALSDITGAREICPECLEAVEGIDWKYWARESIKHGKNYSAGRRPIEIVEAIND